MEHAHFGFIVSAGADFDSATVGKLAVGGRPVSKTIEFGLDAQAFVGDHDVTLLRRQIAFREQGSDRGLHQVRLTLVAARGFGARGDVAESNASFLAAAGADQADQQAVLRQIDAEGLDLSEDGRSANIQICVRAQFFGCVYCQMVRVGRIDDAVRNSNLDRVGGDFVEIHFDRSDDAVFDREAADATTDD